MSRKTYRAIALTAVAATVLAACGGGDDEPSGEPADADNPVTIGFVTDKAAWEPSFEAMNESSGANGLTLDFTGYSDATAYDAFVRQAFRTREVPALFTWHTGPKLQELVDEGLVAETTDLWTAATEEGLVPDGLIDNYTFDGKQYCVPLNIAYWAVYYNKGIFEENGLEPPTTFDELTTVTQTLRDADVTPFHQMNVIFEFVWFQALLMGQDPEVYQGLATGEASYTDPEVIAVMDQWKAMIEEGDYIDPGVTTDPQVLLDSGEVAMAYFGTFFTGQLDAIGAVSGEDYGIFLMPSMGADVPNQMALETGPLCVGAGAENETAALQYSEWWMSTDAQTAWSSERGDISFNPNVPIEDPELAALVDAVTGEGSDVQVQQRWLEATPAPVYTKGTEVFGAWVTTPGDPTEAMQQMQDAADAYWAEQ